MADSFQSYFAMLFFSPRFALKAERRTNENSIAATLPLTPFSRFGLAIPK